MVFCVTSAFSAGCAASRRQTRATAPPVAKKRLPAWPDLYRLLARRHEAFASFQGQGSLIYESADEKIRTAHMVVVKAPERIRIDFRSPFSLTYTVASDGRELSAYDRGEKVLYRGMPTVENLARYTRVPLPLESLIALLRGLPPLPDETLGGKVEAVGDRWYWSATLPDATGLTVLFDSATTLARQVRLATAQGGLDVNFDGFVDVGGERAAQRIAAQLPGGARVEIKYGTIWRDRDHRDSAFRLQAPAGVRVVEMAGSP